MQEMGISSEQQQQHVAVLAFPFGTHAAPLLGLTRRLAAAAPHVRFSFFSTARSNGSIFSSASASGGGFDSNIKAYNVWDGLAEGQVAPWIPTEGIKIFLEATPDNYKKVMKIAEEESGIKISCLLSDAFLWFGGVMAEEMGNVIPWVPLWTAGPCSISAHFHTQFIRHTLGLKGIAGKEGEPINFIPGLSSIRLGDLPEGVISGNLESPFSCMLHDMARMLPKATAVAINSYEEIDPTITNDLKSKLKKFLSVGPFTLTSSPSNNSDEHGCLAWLDKQKNASSVAYISFGSVISPPPNELVAIAEALEESKVPFLWSFRGNIEEQMPKGFVERIGTNGKIVPWAPQFKILQHGSIGVFVTHCGWNSVTECITGGVPMICRPFFGDQSLNRRVVEAQWKIGVGIEGGVFTKSGLMKAFQLIFSGDEGTKMRVNIGVLKKLAFNAVESNGSTVQNFKTLLEVVTNTKA